jgi:hypothetical protein
MNIQVALLTPLLAVAIAGCTNGQAEIDVTTTTVATFPAPPAGAARALGDQAVITDASVTLDVKKDLASLSNLGTLSGEVSKNVVAGQDLDLLEHIKVTIESKDGQMPARLLSEVDIPRHSTEVALPLLVVDSLILEYLTEGQVTVHFYLTGKIPQRTLTLTHTIVAHVNVAVAGSVLKL